MNRPAIAKLRAVGIGGLSLAFTLGALPLLADTPAVTVTAPRELEQLRNEVDTFVSSAITRPYGDDSLLRWDHPLCPLVAGMPRAAGEFALLRLSQIARSAHAPLDSETCKPNLFVIVAKNPEKFLRLWWRHDPRLFNTRFGVAPVRHFIEYPRPVRGLASTPLAGNRWRHSGGNGQSIGDEHGPRRRTRRLLRSARNPSTPSSCITRTVVQRSLAPQSWSSTPRK